MVTFFSYPGLEFSYGLLGNATGYWRTQVPTMLKWTKPQREERERKRKRCKTLFIKHTTQQRKFGKCMYKGRQVNTKLDVKNSPFHLRKMYKGCSSQHKLDVKNSPFHLGKMYKGCRVSTNQMSKTLHFNNSQEPLVIVIIGQLW